MGHDWFDIFQDEFGISKNQPRTVFYIIKFSSKMGKTDKSVYLLIVFVNLI